MMEYWFYLVQYFEGNVKNGLLLVFEGKTKEYPRFHLLLKIGMYILVSFHDPREYKECSRLLHARISECTFYLCF